MRLLRLKLARALMAVGLAVARAFEAAALAVAPEIVAKPGKAGLLGRRV